MATLSAIRDGLKVRLATITSLHAYDVMPDSVNAPAAVVRPVTGDYRGSLAGSPSVRFEIILYVPMARLDRAQDLLDSYLQESGASSVFAAIEADRTLGAVVEETHVPGWRNYDQRELNGQQYLSAIVDVEVWHG